MRKGFLFLLLAMFCFPPGNVSAQTPGYRGHKTLVGVNYSFIPSGRGSWVSELPNIHMSQRFGMEVGQVVSKGLLLSARYDFSRTGIAYGGHIKIKCHTFLVGMEASLARKKGMISPLGPYFRFETGLVHSRQGSAGVDGVFQPAYNITAGVLGIEIGARRVVVKELYLHYAVRVNGVIDPSASISERVPAHHGFMLNLGLGYLL